MFVTKSLEHELFPASPLRTDRLLVCEYLIPRFRYSSNSRGRPS
jgi:hypothetical protein